MIHHSTMSQGLVAFMAVLILTMMPLQAHAQSRSDREIPVSTPGSYGSDSNGATSDNTLSSTTSLLRGESGNEE